MKTAQFMLTAIKEAPATRENIVTCSLFEPNRLNRWAQPTSSNSVLHSVTTGEVGIDGYNSYQMLAKAGTYCDLSQELSVIGSSTSAIVETRSLLKKSTWYTLSFKCRGVDKHIAEDGTLENTGKSTYLLCYVYPGIVDTTSKYRVDGEWKYPAGDMSTIIKIGWDIKTHVITFKTASTFSSVPKLLFRSYGEGSTSYASADFSTGGCFVRIACPKIEEGEEATAYVPHVTEMLQPYQSTVFKRSESKPSKPSGGNYYSPVPSGWNDGIPSGEAKLWASSSLLYPEVSTATWSDPTVQADTSTSDIEFAYETSDGTQPTEPTDSNRHGGSGTQIWFDPVLDSGASWDKMVWRAEQTISNGVRSAWVISRIKGENGINGSSPVVYLIRFTKQVCNVDSDGVCHVDIRWQVIRTIGDSEMVMPYINTSTIYHKYKYSNSDTWLTSGLTTNLSTYINAITAGNGTKYTAISSPAAIDIAFDYDGKTRATASVPFIVSGENGASADPASVLLVDTDIKAIPCTSDGVAKTGAKVTVTAYERNADGDMSAVNPIFVQAIYYVHFVVEGGRLAETSFPIYQGSSTTGSVSFEIPSGDSDKIYIAEHLKIEVYKGNSPAETKLKTITLYPLCDGQQGIQGPTGDEGKPILSMLVSTPSLGFALEHESYGKVVGDAQVKFTALYGASSAESRYFLYDDGVEKEIYDVSTPVKIKVLTSTSLVNYYWRVYAKVVDGTLVVTPSSVDDRAIDGNNNTCTFSVKAKHPDCDEYITQDFTMFVVRRGEKGESLSYTPYIIGVYSENTNYVWNENRRDFVYYPDKTGNYKIWGVKQLGMDFVNKIPGVTYEDDTYSTYWEQGDDYKLLVANCIFGDNAIIGGFKMTSGIMESVKTFPDTRPVNENSTTMEQYDKPLLKIDGNTGVIEMFNQKAGIRIGLDDEKNPCLFGYDTEGELVWSLGTKTNIDYDKNVNVVFNQGSILAISTTSDKTVKVQVRAMVEITNNLTSQTTFTSSSIKVCFASPFRDEKIYMTMSSSITLGVGETGKVWFNGSDSETYTSEPLVIQGSSLFLWSYYYINSSQSTMKDMASTTIS